MIVEKWCSYVHCNENGIEFVGHGIVCGCYWCCCCFCCCCCCCLPDALVCGCLRHRDIFGRAYNKYYILSIGIKRERERDCIVYRLGFDYMIIDTYTEPKSGRMAYAFSIVCMLTAVALLLPRFLCEFSRVAVAAIIFAPMFLFYITFIGYVYKLIQFALHINCYKLHWAPVCVCSRNRWKLLVLRL